jgi:carbon-monoxide dehydrogenase small subunit
MTETGRVEAGELAETRMTVNGVPVVVRLPARVTLADALREHLGLTGTHLGCEHGICGMCTVLVDGAAARACLLFACQLEGAGIVTVEGLGRPGDLHPLQEAFGEQHALQCGFCTPGFLMSAYDLLSRRPGVSEEELPEELSGVLCRCTGYRNILTAVGQVAGAYRDGGLPGPRNCGAAALARRAPRSAAVAAPAGGEVVVGAAPDAPAAGGGAPAAEAHGPGEDATDVSVPQGPPTFVAEVTSTLAASPDEVWRVLGDVRMVARCLPGAELTDDLGGDRYRGRARVGVGPVRLSFRGLAHVVERDEQARTMRVLAQGSDAGGGQTQADIRVSAAVGGPDGGGCRLTAEARVYLSGRIAQFGRALAGDVSRRLFEQFAESVEQAVVSGDVPDASPAAPGALRMLAGALASRLRALIRRRPAP